jgi:hypothetical protein
MATNIGIRSPSTQARAVSQDELITIFGIRILT